MKSRYQKRTTQSSDVEYFVGRGIARPLAEALSGRGISAQSFDGYFGDVWHSPFEMKNMREAADTVSFVLEQGGSVLICGDYDADGLTASSILSLFFSDNGVENDVIIPTRNEGYGLHADLVFKAFEKKFYDLIITVDCGISNRAEVAKIIDELGAEIIVTDHHELPDVLPDCICVNPKMGYPFPNLAGAGVAWKLVEALAGRDVAARYAQLAMIGTVGDIMPMLDENRAIVRLGLANQNHKSLNKLAELSKCSSTITASEISLKIAPKINAAGRVGCPDVALKLLLARDKADVSIANKLMELNEQRKEMLNSLIAQADAMCDEKQIHSQRMVFLHGDWPHGILGIAASRYKEKYNLPAAILTRDGDLFVGSARSIDGINLFELFNSCKEVLAKFGGHKASVGFSVTPDNLPVLQNMLAQRLAELPTECFEPSLYYDVDLTEECVLADMLDFAQKLQPLLPQEKVLFRVQDSVKFANAFGKENSHLSATLSGGLEVKGFFKYAAYAPFIKNGADVDMLVSLEIDSYTKNICGIIEDMRLCNSVCFDGFYKQNFLQNFLPQSVQFATDTQVQKALGCDSVLAVFDDYETYLKACERFDLSDFYVDVFFDNSLCNKTVAVSPLADYDFAKYKTVVCFARQGMVRTVPQGAIYCELSTNQMLYKLHVDRDVCVAVYGRLKRKNVFESLRTVYDKYLAGKLSYEQYLVAVRIFEELKLIKVVDKFTVEFLPSEKLDLASSRIYSCFQQ